MFTRIAAFETLTGRDGNRYRPRAYGEPSEGAWNGWLVFFPASEREPVAVGPETTQSTLQALSYWATGLTRVYLEGALERALNQANTSIQDSLAAFDHLEREALAEAETLNDAAEMARKEAELARTARAATGVELADAVAQSADTTAALHEQAAEEARREGRTAAQQRTAFERELAAPPEPKKRRTKSPGRTDTASRSRAADRKRRKP